MVIVDKKVNELIPYEKNPRKNEKAVKYVANSIKEFGFKVPIVIDAKNVIVAGHTRLLAAKELGLEKVPCVIADDLTDEQIKAFRLADNKVSEKASWDFDLLFDEMDSLEDFFNFEDFGFDDPESTIDWTAVEDLTEKTYDKPEHTMLECPFCHKIDRDIHFKKVKATDTQAAQKETEEKSEENNKEENTENNSEE